MARIMIIEDHSIVRKGIRSLFDDSEQEVVAEAGSGVEAIKKADAIDFDIMIVDIQLPDMLGFDVIKEIKKLKPAVKVIILTMYNDLEFIKRAVEAEIDGFVLKGTDTSTILESVDQVMANQKYFDKEATAELYQVAIKEASKPAVSKREKEILKLVGGGLSNKMIASQLNISAFTVRDHLKSIYEKLEVADRAHAVAKAIRLNIIN